MWMALRSCPILCTYTGYVHHARGKIHNRPDTKENRPGTSSLEVLREFSTKNWKETVMLFNAIAYLAEAVWHHPDVELGFKRLKLKLRTHELDAITERDFKLAKLIEEFLKLVV